jgi:hypothetical protein
MMVLRYFRAIIIKHDKLVHNNVNNNSKYKMIILKYFNIKFMSDKLKLYI